MSYDFLFANCEGYFVDINLLIIPHLQESPSPVRLDAAAEDRYYCRFDAPNGEGMKPLVAFAAVVGLLAVIIEVLR
ncbi:hypothetical protein [Nitratireductor sp. XY-223]|uniref:hypothetical protein n=1 Tax=Nitratireductor sp. XY-223 TaxID=2561926 RepID=UPI0010AA3ABB|nr:hypothetical protein [Nitratireductor sp. XY-223]